MSSNSKYSSPLKDRVPKAATKPSTASSLKKNRPVWASGSPTKKNFMEINAKTQARASTIKMQQSGTPSSKQNLPNFKNLASEFDRAVKYNNFKDKLSKDDFAKILIDLAFVHAAKLKT